MNIQEIRKQYPQYRDLSDDQLGKALHAKYYADMPYDAFASKTGIKPVGVGEDIAKSLAPSAVRGVTNLFGAPADLWEMISGGAAKGAEKLFGMPGLSEIAKPELPLPTSERIRNTLGANDLYKPQTRPGKLIGGTVEGATGAGLFGKAVGGLGALGGLSAELAGAVTDDNPIAKAVGGMAGPLGYQAASAMRSVPGNMIRQATGDIDPADFERAKQLMEQAKRQGIDLMAPEALPPSSIQQLASDVIGSKEGGRVMNQFLANRPDQVKGAVSRGLLDPVAPAATPDVTMSRARQAATDVISDAEKFRTAATRPYYLAQKSDDLGGLLLESRLPGLDDAASSARSSYADLLGQHGQLKTMQAENIGRANQWTPVSTMPRVPGRVSDFPERSAEAAKAAVEVGGERIPASRNAMMAAEIAAKNTRKALEAKDYGRISEGVESILGNIDNEIALAAKGTEKARILTELRGKLAPGGRPLDKPYRIEGVYQETSKRLNPPINAPVEERIAAGVLGEHVKALDDLVQQSSPVLKQGRGLYKEMTERVVEPLTAGPVGRVAGRHGADPSIPETLQPVAAIANEKIARPETIRELYGHLNKQDPKAFPGIVRTSMENAFDMAAQKVQAGDNRMAGANFVKAIVGTPQQEANFLEAMRGVAKANGKDPEEVVRGAKNLMSILQATGRVPGAGSPTGGRLASNEMARNSGWMDALESISTSPTAPVASRIRNWMMGGNYRRVAEVLTAPDAIDQLIKIGKYKPTTTTSMALAAALLEGTSESGR